MSATTQVRIALFAIGAPFLASSVVAQTVANPLPLLLVKDGDGKVVGQVLETHFATGRPRIVLNVEGTPAFLIMTDFGLVDRVSADNYFSTPTVYFSASGCIGDAAVNQVGGLELSVGTHFGVAGPDSALGTYKLYRSTTITSPGMFSYLSKWVNGACVNGSGSSALLPAEEVTPNPLDGFHGPTLLDPDKKWSVAGGTKITPP